MMKIAGFSLLEYVLALTLSVLLLQAVILFYCGFDKQMQQVNQRACELNAVESFSQWFRQAIENAGFRGCRRLSTAPPVIPFEELSLTEENALQLAPKAWQVRYADPGSAERILAINHPQILLLANTRTFAVGDHVLIADCVSAELNRVVKITNQQLILAAPLKSAFSQAEVFLYRDEYYFLKAATLLRREGGRTQTLIKNIQALLLEKTQEGVSATVHFQCQNQVSRWHFWQEVRI